MPLPETHNDNYFMPSTEAVIRAAAEPLKESYQETIDRELRLLKSEADSISSKPHSKIIGYVEI